MFTSTMVMQSSTSLGSSGKSFPHMVCIGSMCLILSGACMVFGYQRGRVRIANNTVVSDQGTLLRANDVFIYPPYTPIGGTQQLYYDIRNQGFNCIRLSVIYDRNWIPNINRDIPSRIPYIDSVVQWTQNAGLYVCIDYHDCGSLDQTHCSDFWSQVAPRYKDRTHVFYELANEPVAWAPENYADQDIAKQKAIYTLIRSYAPNTLIVLLSYATANDNMLSVTNRLTGIDWSNAAVGGHPYHLTTGSGEVLVRTKYPYISTEYAVGPGHPAWNVMLSFNGDGWGWTKFHEQEGMSWMIWNNDTRSASQNNDLLNDARSRGYMWMPDDFNNPPVGAYLTISPDSIYLGDSASLGWQCYQMTAASIDQGIGAVALTGGSRWVKPTQTTTYTLTASGNSQTYTKTATVHIKQLRVPENPTGTTAGLDYKYYEGTWSQLPNFSTLTPVKTGTFTNFDISAANRADNFAFQFTGYVNIPTGGTYTFATASDDGSRLYIGSTLVVNNDGAHGVTEASGTIGLQAGKHAIRVEYFEANGEQSLAVRMNGQAIAPSSLFRSSGSVVALPPARATVAAAPELACYNLCGQRVSDRTARSSTASVLLMIQKTGNGQSARMAVAGSSR